jgi:hypothetical protein
MKLVVVRAVVAAFAAVSVPATVLAQSDDIPFAQQPLARPGQSTDASLLSLGDVMTLVQMRHIKLWYAAKSGNWGLAGYSVDKIKESLFKAAMLYVNIPVELIKTVDSPLTSMKEAAGRKDFKAFSSAYSDLTVACNICHVAGNVGFIRIQTPSASPFSDQAYVNEKKK